MYNSVSQSTNVSGAAFGWPFAFYTQAISAMHNQEEIIMSGMPKPIWNKPYSVASPQTANYLWCDLSMFFNCPSGIEEVRTFLKNDVLNVLFFKEEEICASYVYQIPGMFDWFHQRANESVEHWLEYERWRKGKKNVRRAA